MLIAEGANRASKREKRQRFVEARGECGEAVAAVELLVELGVLDGYEPVRFERLADEMAAMLTGLVRWNT